jgi:hypothetical protein
VRVILTDTAKVSIMRDFLAGQPISVVASTRLLTRAHVEAVIREGVMSVVEQLAEQPDPAPRDVIVQP